MMILHPIRQRRRKRAAALARLGRDSRAVTAVEYAIMAGLLATAIASSAPRIGTALSNTFAMVAQGL